MIIIIKSFGSLKKYKGLLIRKLNNYISNTFNRISKGFNKSKRIKNELNKLKVSLEVFNE